MEDNDFGGLARDLERARLRKEAAANPPSDTMDLLHEREMTHGYFEDHARITQRLKSIVYCEAGMREEWGREPLSPEQFESLDMICHKMGRIIAGDADFADHWDDIAGYAKLCSRLPDPTPEEYPFTSHRTMAEIMATEEPTEHYGVPASFQLWRKMNQENAFGEGDETDAEGPSIFRHPGVRCACNGTGVIGGVIAKCLCNGDGGGNPIPMPTGDCLLDGRNCPPDHEHPTPKWDAETKRACMCERGRCKVDNGWTLGLDIYCCQGERG